MNNPPTDLKTGECLHDWFYFTSKASKYKKCLVCNVEMECDSRETSILDEIRKIVLESQQE